MTTTEKKTIAEFAKTYAPFLKACKKAGVEPSKNEASKFRAGIGKAIKFSNEQWRSDSHQRFVNCNKCGGSGFGKHAKKKLGLVCSNCAGTGRVKK